MNDLNLLRKLWMLAIFCLALNAHAQSAGKDTKVTIGDTAMEICEEPDEMPKAEKPAMKDGKPVCCRMALPINFRIR